jgi:hypothetical protein
MPATATTSDQGANAPVLGRRRSQAARTSFQLAIYRGETEELWNFTVRAQMDTSSVFSLSAEDVTAGQRLGGLRNFLMRSFVDDDGVSLHESPVQVVEAEEADEETGVTSGDLVPLGDDTSAGRETQWRVGGELFPSESLAKQYANENGSSLRRLIYVMDSPYLTVEQTALEEIVDVIVSAAADRPTKPSGASSRSRSPRQR